MEHRYQAVLAVIIPVLSREVPSAGASLPLVLEPVRCERSRCRT